MGQQVVAVADTTDSRINVALAVGVEGGLAKVGREGGVREPASRIQEVRFALLHVSCGSALRCTHLTRLHTHALGLGIDGAIDDSHSFSLMRRCLEL